MSLIDEEPSQVLEPNIYADRVREGFRRRRMALQRMVEDPMAAARSDFGMPVERQARYPTLPDAEAESLKSKILGAGGSLLGQIGGALDKLGFRQIRALASGHLEDIPQSLIPFGGTLGLENPEHNLTWDQILTGKGRVLPKLIPTNDPTRYEARDIIPTLFETFAGPPIPKLAPLTKLGRLAEQTGTLPRTLAQQARGFAPATEAMRAEAALPRAAAEAWRAPTVVPEAFTERLAREGIPRAQALEQPLRAGVEFGVMPFGLGPRFQLGGGARTQSALDLLTGLSQKAQFSPNFLGGKVPNPVPTIRSLFDARAGRTANPEIQFSNITRAVPTREAIETSARGTELGIRNNLQDVLRAHGLEGNTPDVMNYLRDRAEGHAVTQNVNDWVNERLLPNIAKSPDQIQAAQEVGARIAGAAPQLNEIADKLRERFGNVGFSSVARGYPHKELADQYLDYVTRQSLPAGEAVAAPGGFQSIGAQIWGTATPSQQKRLEALRDVPGGTTFLNRLSQDPQLVGPARLHGQKAVSYIQGLMAPDVARVGADPAEMAVKAQQLAKYMGGLNPARLESGGSALFAGDPIADLTTRYARYGKAAGSTEGMYDLVRRMAQPISPEQVAAGEFMPISEIAKRFGLSNRDELNRILGIPAGDVRSLRGYGLPSPLANEMLTAQTKYLTPHEIGPIQDLWNRGQNLFKSMVYGAFPASHTRNYLGGMYNNWVRGAYDPRFAGYGLRDWFGARKYIQPQLDIRRLLSGGEVPGFDRQELLQNLYAGKVLGQGGVYSEQAVPRRFADEGVAKLIKGEAATPSIGQTVRGGLSPYLSALGGTRPEGGWRSLLPWATQEMPGFPGTRESINPLIQAGRTAGETIENQLRGGQALAYMRQGFSPEAAARRTLETHFNYQDLAPFEQNVMKSIFPFYTFTRKNIPYQLGQMFENPNKTGQTIRLFNNLRGDSYVPSYLGGDFAFPVSPEDETGQRRYLSKTGLPIEEALSRFHANPMDMLNEVLGMANPYVKGLLEQATGRQFFTGRDLDQLHPSGLATGYGAIQGRPAQLLTQIAMNSPASRLVSVIDQLADPRKTALAKMLNLGTGFKLSDVDVERSRQIDARKALEELMMGNPALKNFQEFYLPQDQYADVAANDPRTMEMMRLFSTMKKQASEAQARQRALAQVQ